MKVVGIIDQTDKMYEFTLIRDYCSKYGILVPVDVANFLNTTTEGIQEYEIKHTEVFRPHEKDSFSNYFSHSIYPSSLTCIKIDPKSIKPNTIEICIYLGS